MDDTTRAPYHPGSLAVQERVGVRAAAEHVGRSIGRGIRPVAAAFLEIQPMLVIGAADGDGRVWSSLLTGPPGFVRATGPTTVAVRGGVPAHDPLAAAFPEGRRTPVGTIALDPRTRRRMRLNGTATATPQGLSVQAHEVFSNCPKYLQKREPYETAHPAPPGPVRRGVRLDKAQADAVRAADTFFVATVGPDGSPDASHRGGNPGFVRVLSPTELIWPDYAGNAMFLTLGNLVADARAGLLFPDWTTGATLQLTGTARTEFTPEGRAVRFTVTGTAETPHASPLRWSPPEYSPANP
ncbi:pyridoxamine 5'-phosphate oxidase family protein [Streptomyces sp. enrichment culture]|uniref:pyridoxamine 5'-phosphate oxidase family protein n=1 Tax=Streptomyces sp. enrichment culture TaxID=1795815 RepID=UPI003F572918